MKYVPPPGSADADAPYLNGIPGLRKGSPVDARAVEHPQREIVHCISSAGLDPSGEDLTQLAQAIIALARAQLPGIATTDANGLVHPDGVTINIDATGKISVAQSDKYDVGEFYYFRHPTLKPGFAPAQGGLISGMWHGAPITEYPIWQYLQTSEGQLLLKTETEWQAMTRATWHTNADGTKVGWDGIGGAPFLVQDLGAGTLRMPDLRGMLVEAAGFASLGVGGVDGDTVRPINGSVTPTSATASGTAPVAAFSDASGVFRLSGAGLYMNGLLTRSSTLGTKFEFDVARVMPTGPVNAPRRWGALACVYLGTPAS